MAERVGIYRKTFRDGMEVHCIYVGGGDRPKLMFEGANRTECLRYCHDNGMQMMCLRTWLKLGNTF